MTLEIIQIEKTVFEEMLRTMEYQTRLIENIYKKMRKVEADTWLSVDEAASVLSVSSRKVRTMISLGHLGFIKKGRSLFVKASDLTTHIKKQ